MKTPLAFEAAKFDGILKKLSEFGAEDGAMGEVAAACNGGDPPGAASVATLVTYLNTWPVDKLFPLLDVCRMVALRGEAAGVSAELAAAAAAACARSVAETPRLPANLLTAGRLFCNAFKHAGLRDAFLLHASQILVSDDEAAPVPPSRFCVFGFDIRLAVRSFLGPRFNHRGARSNHTAPPVPSPCPARTIRRRGDM
jgi:phospholipase A-2-activating protein